MLLVPVRLTPPLTSVAKGGGCTKDQQMSSPYWSGIFGQMWDVFYSDEWQLWERRSWRVEFPSLIFFHPVRSHPLGCDARMGKFVATPSQLGCVWKSLCRLVAVRIFLAFLSKCGFSRNPVLDSRPFALLPVCPVIGQRDGMGFCMALCPTSRQSKDLILWSGKPLLLPCLVTK